MFSTHRLASFSLNLDFLFNQIIPVQIGQAQFETTPVQPWREVANKAP